MAEKVSPKSWTSSPLKQLFSFVLGGDWGKDPLKFEDKNYELALCVRGSEIKNWKTKKASTAVERLMKNTSLEKRTLLHGDVLIEISGGGPEQPVGRTIYVDRDSLKNDKNIPLVCTNFLRMMRFNKALNSKYIQYYLQLFYDSGSIINYQGGSNNLRNLKFKEFETIELPLAPRPEQDRIVAKVDVLMAQITSMQKSLARIPQLLKGFRQQVLTQAVTGKLTEEWRGSRSVTIKSPITIGETTDETNTGWQWINLNNIAKLESGHTPRKGVDEYWENGDIPWICLQDIRAVHGKVIMDTKFKTTTLGIQNSSARLLPKGTVCFSRDISVGFTTIMGLEMSTTQHFANWICGKDLNNKYLLYAFMQSKNYLITKGKGTTVSTLYYKDLKQMMFYKPPMVEQLKIVEIVESLLKKSEVLEERYQVLKTKIDSLPQAILHKAFKGELVNQLPTDGDAQKLLKEIEELKGKKPAKKSSKNKNTSLDAKPGTAYQNDKQTIDALFETVNYDYEVAAIQMLTERRFGFTYGKKYTHKMFSNIELLNTMPKFKDLVFEEKGWGMFSKAIAKTIDAQRFVFPHQLDNGVKVLKVKSSSFKEVLDWTAKKENKEFVAQVNAMLDLYEKPLINKDMNRIELFNTVLECMNVLETDNLQAIRAKMENWEMTEEYNKTKAEKFTTNETLHMIGFIKQLN